MKKYIQEVPKHECEEYYTSSDQALLNINSEMYIVPFHYCKKCEIYSLGNRDFPSLREMSFFIKETEKNLEELSFNSIDDLFAKL